MMMYDNIHSGISDIGSVDIAGENESDIFSYFSIAAAAVGSEIVHGIA